MNLKVEDVEVTSALRVRLSSWIKAFILNPPSIGTPSSLDTPATRCAPPSWRWLEVATQSDGHEDQWAESSASPAATVPVPDHRKNDRADPGPSLEPAYLAVVVGYKPK